MANCHPAVDFIGRRFTRLTVLEFVGYKDLGNRTRPQFRCLCDCGTEVIRLYGGLHTGVTKSCGCLHRERRTKHGGTGTKVYAVWRAMHERCVNPKVRNYPNYGGRGINVCERWKDYAAFRDDMGPRPDGGTLDRINNDGNYEPGNCRWATQREQMNNVRKNVRLTFRGETRTVSEWARRLGVTRDRLYWRLKTGWPIEEALTKGWSRGERRDLA